MVQHILFAALKDSRKKGTDFITSVRQKSLMRMMEKVGFPFQLATRLLGSDWLTPAHFRFGASSLLDDLLVTLGVVIAQDDDRGGY